MDSLRDRFSTGANGNPAIEQALLQLVPNGAALVCGRIIDATNDLFPTEQDQIARAVDKRRWEFSTGRHYARSALAKIGHPPVALPSDDQRKPRWPDGVVGSITHIDSYCAVMVAKRQHVATLGLDIERIADVSKKLLPELSEVDEQTELAKHVGTALMPALTFSAREAVFKAYHPITNYFLGFKDVRLSLDGDRFTAHILRPEIPMLMGQKEIHGRFLVAEDLILSAVNIPA